MLSLGGKKIPTPYRINIPYQSDRKKYGKSDPDTLTTDTRRLVVERNFDLNKATEQEIRSFMEKNMLGIDCSGFVYHLLDYLLRHTNKGGMENIGFPPAQRTNVWLLTSKEFTIPVDDLTHALAGDLIKLNSGQDLLHCLIVLDHQNSMITYTHSSRFNKPSGIQIGKITEGKFPDDLQVFSYNPNKGDGIRRLKMLK
mgnify:FL=1